MASLGFSIYSILSCANSDSFTSSFPIWIPLFFLNVIAATCELGGHYAKLNKSDRERQILYDITYMRNLKIKQTSEYNRKEADSQI